MSGQCIKQVAAVTVGALCACLLMGADAVGPRTLVAPEVFASIQKPEWIHAYWTARRLARALPEPLLQAGFDPTDGNLEALPESSLAFPSPAKSWDTGGVVAQTLGRLFFRTPSGRNKWCTANAVVSRNKSTVLTAAHCIKGEGNKRYNSHFLFVPNDSREDKRAARWAVIAYAVTGQWQVSCTRSDNVGAVVVEQREGLWLTDLVGGTPLEFHHRPRSTEAGDQRYGAVYVFGYPAKADTATPPVYCSGVAGSLSPGPGLPAQPTLFPCTRTGGASGAPWLLNFSVNNGQGEQIAVSGMGGWGFMIGTAFGQEAWRLYDAAQRYRP